MDLEFSAAYADFENEVATFVADHWTNALQAQSDAAGYAPAFRRLAVERGYLYRAFPKHLGGSEQPADPQRAQIIRRVFERARAPMELDGIGVSMLAPTLLEHGTDWQKENFIPGTLNGEIRWAQGYSESGAGSDLAALKTRGELQGEEWVINGHKIWTTRAYRCTHMFALVRTESEAGKYTSKHGGISYLLFKLDQPGVTIRRIHQITGQSEFCEIFLDDVRTPADWIVGGRGEGWNISRTTLKHERNMIGGEKTVKLFESLIRLAHTSTIGGRPAMEDPVLRDRMLAIEGHVRAQMYSGFYQFTRQLQGESTGSLGLMNKLAATDIGLRIAEIASDIVGDQGLTLADDANATPEARWINQILGSLALSIAGGASNIQRNVIAERGLGLPRAAV